MTLEERRKIEALEREIYLSSDSSCSIKKVNIFWHVFVFPGLVR